MKKKIISLGLLLALLTGQTVVQALGDPFPDVSGKSERAAAIDFLKVKGITSGYPDGTFRPDNTINRAEALKLVFLARKALSLPEVPVAKTLNFPDVNKTDWFYGYVESAYNLGEVQGYQDGLFKPANEITATESLKIIYSGLIPDLSLPTVTADPYTDVKSDQWYAPYVEFGRQKLLIEARGDGSYLPERKMSRADFAEALYRTMYIQLNKTDRFPINLNWRACNNFEMGYSIKRPFSWLTLPAGNQLILWKQDVANRQVSFGRVFPNSLVAIVAVDNNEGKLTLQSYMDQIEYGAGATKQVITLNGMPYAYVSLPGNGLQDSYLQLSNGKILVIYAQMGDGPLGPQLKEELRYIIGSIRESSTSDGQSENCLATLPTATQSAPATDNSSTVVTSTTPALSASEQLKAEILKMVLVEGQATEVTQKLTDENLFETDSIGIGTGPVDYYYSQTIDLTLKIDRNSATILATKSGKSSSF